MGTKKIALYGGSFNPIHNQHIQLVNSMLEQKIVDEVWIIPSKNHPHSKQLTLPKHRTNMIKLSFKNPKIKINDIELKSNEINYTIRTISKLKEQYPKGYEFYWTMGSDILHDMNDGWVYLDSLLNETEFIIFKRKNYEIKNVPNMKIYKTTERKENNISSTQIRKLASQNKSLKNLVPSAVEEYIRKEEIY